MNWFTHNLKYDVALCTILVLVAVVVWQEVDPQMPETVVAYEAEPMSGTDAFMVLWDIETDKEYEAMYPEARIRALKNISDRTGVEVVNINPYK